MKYQMSKEMYDYILSHPNEDYVYPEPDPSELGAAYRIKSEKWKKDMSEMMTGEGNPMWGKQTSATQKRSVSQAMMGKKKDYKVVVPKTVLCGAKNGMARAIIVDGVEYPTVTEAAKQIGVSRVTVNNRLKKGVYLYK